MSTRNLTGFCPRGPFPDPTIGFGTFHGGPNFVEHLFSHLLFGACTIINQKWDCDMVFFIINFPEIKRFEVLKLTDQRELAGRWRFWLEVEIDLESRKEIWRVWKFTCMCELHVTLFPCPWNLVSGSIEPLLTWAHWVCDLHDIAWYGLWVSSTCSANQKPTNYFSTSLPPFHWPIFSIFPHVTYQRMRENKERDNEAEIDKYFL